MKKQSAARYLSMNKNLKSGFTLVELMIAMALFGIIFGTIFYMITSSLNARHESTILNQMMTLAKTKMNEIKMQTKENSQEDEFETWPDYNYQYSIIEIEFDLLGFKNDLESSDDLESPIDKFRKTDETRDTVTGGIVRLLHYTVTVKHRTGTHYTLDFYRAPSNI